MIVEGGEKTRAHIDQTVLELWLFQYLPRMLELYARIIGMQPHTRLK